ncbi:MAG: heavy-metal-associated domain-containing protein [Clostridioides sp.]|jgi:copper chaperone CopZ|nr:heavy-metal-associated domain-containing protein [Clostridioides sp.]
MEKKLLIDGMSCSHCVNNVSVALTEDMDGVKVIEVSLEGKYAIVDMDEDVKEDKISEVLEDSGFSLKGIQ